MIPMAVSEMKSNLRDLLVDIIKADVLPQDYYLAGGTAVFLYFNHRLSIDFDFFTLKTFKSEIFLSHIKRNFKDLEVEILEKDTIILFLTKDKIKFSLFYYPYSMLDSLQYLEIDKNIKCSLASYYDIIAMKTIAIVQRGSAKDFIDLFYLLKKSKMQFHEVLGLVKNKYGVKDRYEYQIKTSFTYFDDAEGELSDIYLINEENNPEQINERTWHNIKRYFIEYVQ